MKQRATFFLLPLLVLLMFAAGCGKFDFADGDIVVTKKGTVGYYDPTSDLSPVTFEVTAGTEMKVAEHPDEEFSTVIWRFSGPDLEGKTFVRCVYKGTAGWVRAKHLEKKE